MTADPLAFLRAAHAAAEELAERAASGHTLPQEEHVEPDRRGKTFWPLAGARARYEAAATGKFANPDLYAGLTLIEANSPAAVLGRIEAERRLIAEHGRGSAAEERSETECRTCSETSPGMSGMWPVDYPCPTVRHVAEAWGWTEETT